MPIKAGIFTSEFLGVIVSWVVAALVITRFLPAEQAPQIKDQLLQIVNLSIQAITVLGALYAAARSLIQYINARTQLKTVSMQQASQKTLLDSGEAAQ